jgi:ankyrin repeat protein
MVSSYDELQFDVYWEMFISVIKSGAVKKVYCVIDGVDECSESSQIELLNAIDESFTVQSGSNLPPGTGLRLLLTSRITSRAWRLGRLLRMLDIQPSDVNPDIERFISFHIKRIIGAGVLPEDLSSTVEYILNGGAQGMFLWAALSLEDISRIDTGISLDGVLEQLQDVPRDVEGVYARVVEAIQSHEGHLKLAKIILGTLLFAFADLTLGALSIACNNRLQSSKTHSELQRHVDLRFDYSTKAACGSFLTISDGMVRICHHSARQYLLSPKAGSLNLKATEHHLRLTIVCLHYLLLDDIEVPEKLANVDAERFPFLPYAWKYWQRHLKASEDLVIECPSLIQRFFDPSKFPFKSRLKNIGLLKDNEDLSDTLILHSLAHFDLDNVLRFTKLNTSSPQRTIAIQQDFPPILILDTYPNAGDFHSRTALMYAAAAGSLDVIQLLLSLGADPNSRDSYGYICLHHAISCDSIGAMKALLPHVAAMDQWSSIRSSLLYTAAEHDRVDAMRLLLENGSELDSLSDGLHPLHGAASKGSSSAIRTLLDLRVDVDVRTSSSSWLTAGCTALHVAVHTDQNDTVRFFVSVGANVVAVDVGGRTALHTAAQKGNIDIAKFLLEHDAAIEAITQMGNTPLSSACEENQLPMARFLVEKGANINFAHPDRHPMLPSSIIRGNMEIAKFLIEQGIDLELSSTTCGTALLVAAGADRESLVTLLLDRGANPLCKEGGGLNILHQLATHGRVALLRRVLENPSHPRIESLDSDEWTPLHFAAWKGHRDFVLSLLDFGAAVDAKTGSGATALYLASDKGHLDVVDLLLESKAGVDIGQSDGWTPLFQAAGNGHLNIVKALIRAGADLHAETDAGWTVIHDPARKGHSTIVELLILKGLNPNVRGPDAWTPLLLAARYGQLSVVQTLLQAHVDLSLNLPDGTSPLHLAAEGKRFSAEGKHIVADGIYVQITELLLKHGMSASHSNDAGWTPLHHAACAGDIDVVTLLFNYNIDINARAKDSATPLYTAAQGNSLTVVDFLLLKGAAPNVAAENGSLPVIPAIARGNADMVKSLLRAGSNVAAKAKFGYTALHVATWFFDIPAIKHLIDHGADPRIRDGLGMSCLDWAWLHEPTFQSLGKWCDSYTPLSAAEKSLRFHLFILDFLKQPRETVEMPSTPSTQLAHAFLLIDQLEDAHVAFEQNIIDRETLQHNCDCSSCKRTTFEGKRYVCKTCMDTDLCSDCMEMYRAGTDVRGCVRHEFIEVPRPEWRTFEPGTVNQGGESVAEWLIRMRDKYETIYANLVHTHPDVAHFDETRNGIEDEQ